MALEKKFVNKNVIIMHYCTEMSLQNKNNDLNSKLIAVIRQYIYRAIEIKQSTLLPKRRNKNLYKHISQKPLVFDLQDVKCNTSSLHCVYCLYKYL